MSLTSLLSRRPRFLSSSPKSKSKSSSPTPPPAMSTAQAPVLAEYRRLGKAGIRVSVPILGGMGIGNPVWNPISQPEEKAFPLLKAAWDSGVTTWDLANMYSNGECESIAGKFIKENNLPRNQITLITKIRFLVHHEPSTVTSFFLPAKEDERTYNNQSGLSRVAIFNQVEASLKRLQTDYIDILLIHMADLETPFEETMCALNDLVRAGKVHYIGASNVKTWEFIEMNNVAQANGWTQFSCVQMEHSLLYRVEERDLFAYCNYKGIGIMAYSPLMDGHLARDPGTETDRSKFVKGGPFDKAVTDSDRVIIERVKEISKKHNWTMAQVALAWSLAKVASPVIGANTPERLREAIISGKSLTQEEIAYLEQPYTYKSQRW